MEDFTIITASPVTTALEHRFSPLGNSFLNLMDSEDLTPVARGRSRSCPVAWRAVEEEDEEEEEQAEEAEAEPRAEPRTAAEPQAEEQEEPVQQTTSESWRAVKSRLLQEAQLQQQLLQGPEEERVPAPAWQERPAPAAQERPPRQRNGMRSLPASSRPATLVVTKSGMKPAMKQNVSGPAPAGPSESAACTRADWQQERGASDTTAAGTPDPSPSSPWKVWEPVSPLPESSPTSPTSWADCWLEEQSELASPISPQSPSRWGMPWPEELVSEQGTVADQTPKLHQKMTKDGRPITTLMIQNIPGTLTQKTLAQTLDDSGFSGQYDFLYLPTAFSSGASHGYAFINFPNPEAAMQLTGLWDRRRPWGRSMEKALHIRPAVLQGIDANVARWNSAKMRRVRNPEHRPMVLPLGGAEQGPPPISPPPSSHGRPRRVRASRR